MACFCAHVPLRTYSLFLSLSLSLLPAARFFVDLRWACMTSYGCSQGWKKPRFFEFFLGF